MQVTEVSSDGLKRSYRVVCPAAAVEDKLTAQLNALKSKVRLNGFRPGKVPVAHLRRLYGRSVMGDVIEETVNEASRKIVDEHGFKLALEPRVKFPEDKALVEAMTEGKSDLDFSLDLEVLPVIPAVELSDLSFVRDVVVVDDAVVEEALRRVAERNRNFTPADAGYAATKGDRLTVDFEGTVDGQPFEGGEAKDIKVVLGEDSFIPGFEQGLEGATAGETRLVDATFPQAYGRPELAGRNASFQVQVKEVARPDELKIDDDLGKALGMESLDALRAALKASAEREFALASRQKLKRQLLDELDKRVVFELPPTMLEQEFTNIWTQVETEMKNSGKSFADENTTEEAARADYRRIAERRVRLGLFLADVGQKANISVSDDELTQAIVARARQFPGQERTIWDFYKKTPQALGELRAPIVEEKVVDHLLGQAKLEERQVTREEMFKDEEETEAEPSA